jgi:hypothetical protein
MVNRLARLRGTTSEGLSMKTMVLAQCQEAFDDPDIWNEKLQISLMTDIATNAKAVA